MRILYCNYEYPPLGGGGGVINKQIAEELAKTHTVDVLTSQGLGLPPQTDNRQRRDEQAGKGKGGWEALHVRSSWLTCSIRRARSCTRSNRLMRVARSSAVSASKTSSSSTSFINGANRAAAS